jgi:hypothetical protein
VSSNLNRHERIAPLYDLLDLPFEYSRYRKIRPLLFQGLKGRVLDAGIYPPEVQVIGIDISPAVRQTGPDSEGEFSRRTQRSIC